MFSFNLRVVLLNFDMPALTKAQRAALQAKLPKAAAEGGVYSASELETLTEEQRGILAQLSSARLDKPVLVSPNDGDEPMADSAIGAKPVLGNGSVILTGEEYRSWISDQACKDVKKSVVKHNPPLLLLTKQGGSRPASLIDWLVDRRDREIGGEGLTLLSLDESDLFDVPAALLVL